MTGPIGFFEKGLAVVNDEVFIPQFADHVGACGFHGFFFEFNKGFFLLMQA